MSTMAAMDSNPPLDHADIEGIDFSSIGDSGNFGDLDTADAAQLDDMALSALANDQAAAEKAVHPPPPRHDHYTRSSPRAIPSKKPSVEAPPQASSAGSTGSNFMNNILNSTGGTFNNTQMSHTPPTQASTSYEASHFGKRQRSGSISERLQISARLEEKGLIDKDQKGVLKDLIISGDSELQAALDKYEQGDPAALEGMIQSGALANRAGADIDLLGDLDLDFLNVDDGNDLGPMAPPSSQFGGSGNFNTQASDGIGELDFDAGLGGENSYRDARAPSPPPMDQNNNARSRANSTFSLDEFRSRSNSLFSALIGPDGTTEIPSTYGRWMETNQPDHTSSGGIHIQPGSRRASAPGQVGLGGIGASLAAHMEEDFIEDMQMDAKPLTKQEKAEAKRRVKQEKKEQREREKKEKKERKEQAKIDKHKKMDVEEREEHVPGSGRPRSLSDPCLRISLDEFGLQQVERPDGWIGAYSPESRKVRIERFLEKRNHRVWTKTVKYDVRKNFADSRLRVKGRFVKKEDELLMRELMSLT